MRFTETFLTVDDEFVTEYGSRGQCAQCKRAPAETASINRKFYCRECVLSKFLKNKTVAFEPSDAKFKCPSEVDKCDADQLSVDEFFIGNCCENSLLWTKETLKLERLTFANKVYKESRKDEDTAETMAENAAKEAETSREIYKAAKRKVREANDELYEKTKWRKTVQKRTLFLASEAMKEDNSDLESEYVESSEESSDENAENTEDEATEEDSSDIQPVDGQEGEESSAENAENTDERNCKICFEEYGQEDCIRAVIIPCVHQSCYKCLSSLRPKICPFCRAEFPAENMLKLI